MSAFFDELLLKVIDHPIYTTVLVGAIASTIACGRTLRQLDAALTLGELSEVPA